MTFRYAHVFIFILFVVSSCKADDQLTPAKPLSRGELLVSENGVFALGFFSPNSSNTSLYVGIWYHGIPERTYVWVANRDRPLAGDSSAVLAVTNSSDLVLSDSRGRTVWMMENNISSAGGATAALLNTGNLVLRSPNGTLLWQSFYYPTDTILPGMTFTVNYNTHTTSRLFSWRGPGDPGHGDFSFAGDAVAYPQIFLVWRGSSPYWRAGAWDGTMVSHAYESITNAVISFTTVNNGDVISTRYDISDGSQIMRITIDYAGTLKVLQWSGSAWITLATRPGPLDCDVYASCGPFGVCDNTAAVSGCSCLSRFLPIDSLNLSKGCRRKEALRCGDGDRFVTLRHMKTPDNPVRVRNKTLQECEALCLSNCSCSAYAYANLSSNTEQKLSSTTDPSRCLVWFGELVDLEEYTASGEDLYLRIAGQPIVHKRKSIFLLLTLATILPVLVCIYVIRICKLRGKRRTWSDTMQGQVNKFQDSGDQNSEFPYISFKDIISATNGFDDSSLLGKGGFGKVYKGTLECGKEVAVKRLTKCSDQGIEHFRNEVVLIAKLQHRSLVRLLGYCIHGDEKLLIYEYLPNKSLDYFLFDDAKRLFLDWPTRFNIIKGVARGLLYLHQDSRMTIIHRDLKASNILLDMEMRPKISDFGMARMFGDNQQEEKTRRVVGTYGYMSPEYAMGGTFSVKSDTYSFGILLLEIASGQKISSPHPTIDFQNLVAHAWNLWKDGKTRDFVDSVILESCSLQEVSLCIHIGLLCVQDNPDDRPFMSQVVTMLGNEAMAPLLPVPTQPVYVVQRKHREEDARDNLICSINKESLTSLEGR